MFANRSSQLPVSMKGRCYSFYSENLWQTNLISPFFGVKQGKVLSIFMPFLLGSWSCLFLVYNKGDAVNFFKNRVCGDGVHFFGRLLLVFQSLLFSMSISQRIIVCNSIFIYCPACLSSNSWHPFRHYIILQGKKILSISYNLVSNSNLWCFQYPIKEYAPHSYRGTLVCSSILSIFGIKQGAMQPIAFQRLWNPTRSCLPSVSTKGSAVKCSQRILFALRSFLIMPSNKNKQGKCWNCSGLPFSPFYFRYQPRETVVYFSKDSCL